MLSYVVPIKVSRVYFTGRALSQLSYKQSHHILHESHWPSDDCDWWHHYWYSKISLTNYQLKYHWPPPLPFSQTPDTLGASLHYTMKFKFRWSNDEQRRSIAKRQLNTNLWHFISCFSNQNKHNFTKFATLKICDCEVRNSTATQLFKLKLKWLLNTFFVDLILVQCHTFDVFARQRPKIRSFWKLTPKMASQQSP